MLYLVFLDLWSTEVYCHSISNNSDTPLLQKWTTSDSAMALCLQVALLGMVVLFTLNPLSAHCLTTSVEARSVNEHPAVHVIQSS